MFVTVFEKAKLSFVSFQREKQTKTRNKYIGSDKGERTLRFFKNERPQESFHQVFELTDNDAARSRYCVIFQGNVRGIRYSLSNTYQFVSSRLCGASAQAQSEVGGKIKPTKSPKPTLESIAALRCNESGSAAWLKRLGLNKNWSYKKMKKVVLLALVAFSAWGYYAKNGGSLPALLQNSKSTSANKNQKNYHCDGRQHCSQMSSYEEAKYFIDNCPNTKMDGDNDGIPCERQFGR